MQRVIVAQESETVSNVWEEDRYAAEMIQLLEISNTIMAEVLGGEGPAYGGG